MLVTRDPRLVLAVTCLGRTAQAELGRPWRSLVLQSAISSRAENICTVSREQSSLYWQTLSIQLVCSEHRVRDSDRQS